MVSDNKHKWNFVWQKLIQIMLQPPLQVIAGSEELEMSVPIK